MSAINVVMCAGFSPSARMVRKALRRVAEREDIRVITPCPAGAGLNRYVDELKALDPGRTMVVEGCDGCCGLQALMLHGITPAQTVVADKVIAVTEKDIAATEEKIVAAMKEMRA
jgi:DGC domain